MDESRGLLLLDVDGPLNPYLASPDELAGFRTYRDTPEGEWVADDDGSAGYRVWLHPGHGSLLTALAEETGLELVWATAWQHAANARIAPAIGLEPLPVIEFHAGDAHVDENGRLTWRVDGGWKWPSVMAYAAGRPLAWFDDQLNDPDFALARAAFDRDRTGAPTLLCHVDPRFGLREPHCDEVRGWAAGLP